MRIGIDTAPIVQHRNRGVGALGGFLLEAMLRAKGSHYYLLFTPGEGGGTSFGVAFAPNAETVSRAGCGDVFSLSWIRDALRLHGQVKLSQLDVFHAYFQWNLPLRRMPVPVVGSIYDLMPLAVRDIYLDRYALPVRAKIGMYSRYLNYALGRVDRVIAISEHSRADLVRLTGYPEERVHVVYPAPAPGMMVPENEDEIRLLRERRCLEKDYLLYVGGFDYRKNLEMLLGAYGRARKRGMDLPLALAGDMSSPYGRLIQNLVNEAGGEGAGIRLLGHIPDNDLPALYAGARLFLYPSLYEGFGLPILDAMTCGTPVISSRAASLPEAAGEAAILLDPNDEEAWAAAIIQAAEAGDALEERRLSAIRHASSFTWERAASETLAVYKMLAGHS